MYEKLEDVRGACEMLAKKSVVAQMRGDVKLAEDWAVKYLSLYQKHFDSRERTI